MIKIRIGLETLEFATHTELNQYLKDRGYHLRKDGKIVKRSGVGIIPQILNKWFSERLEYKNLMKEYINSGDTEKADYYDKRQHIQKILLNCFSPDTDVMSVDGIKNIRDLKVGDLVYSINPKTMEVEKRPVTRVYEYDYKGDMININTNHIDFSVTPNHRMLTSVAHHPRKGGFGEYDWELAGEITTGNIRRLPPKTSPFPGVYKEKFDLESWCVDNNIPVISREDRIRYYESGGPGSGRGSSHTKFQPSTYDMSDWLEFMGWYISEGSLYSNSPKLFESGNYRGKSHSITITQKNSRHIKNLTNLVERLRLENVTHGPSGFSFSSQPIFEFLERECGRGSANKKIPNWVFELSSDQLQHLYDSMMRGDGNSSGQRYTTKSKRLANDFVRLAHHLGNKNAYITEYPTESSGSSSCYRVQIGEHRGVVPTFKYKKHVTRESYNGKVHCVEVKDNHTLLAGRNGKFNWIGQSIYGTLGLPVFRFYDVDNALAVTATGQTIIKGSEKYVNHFYNKKLQTSGEDYCTYIDTDSLYFSCLPLYEEYDGEADEEEFCIELARNMEGKLNSFYDVFCKKMFNVSQDHRMYIKGENIVKTGLWITKKRYAMLVVYDLETNEKLDPGKMKVKGLDVVRSSFPPAFSAFSEDLLNAILYKKPRSEVDNMITTFKNNLDDIHYLDILRNTSIKDIEKYDNPAETSLVKYKKGSPAHVKAGIAHNRFLQAKGLETKYAPIRSGDKIRYGYVKNNPYGIDVFAIKGYEDAPEALEFLLDFLDRGELFDRELKKKIQAFYDALGWGVIPTEVNQNMSKFFEF